MSCDCLLQAVRALLYSPSVTVSPRKAVPLAVSKSCRCEGRLPSAGPLGPWLPASGAEAVAQDGAALRNRKPSVVVTLPGE